MAPTCCSSACTTPAAPRWPPAGCDHHAGDRVDRALRPAPRPADTINPAAVEAMAEVGIDIAAAAPQAAHRRGRPGRRRRHHHGLRRRLPDLPRHALRGLGRSTTPPARTSPRSGPSATRSDTASKTSSPASSRTTRDQPWITSRARRAGGGDLRSRRRARRLRDGVGCGSPAGRVPPRWRMAVRRDQGDDGDDPPSGRATSLNSSVSVESYRRSSPRWSPSSRMCTRSNSRCFHTPPKPSASWPSTGRSAWRPRRTVRSSNASSMAAGCELRSPSPSRRRRWRGASRRPTSTWTWLDAPASNPNGVLRSRTRRTASVPASPPGWR